MTEDEMVGWHHGLNGHEFEQTPGDGEGQGSLVCCMQSMGSQRAGHNSCVEELTLLNCGVRKDSLKSLGLQGDQTSQT